MVHQQRQRPGLFVFAGLAQRLVQGAGVGGGAVSRLQRGVIAAVSGGGGQLRRRALPQQAGGDEGRPVDARAQRPAQRRILQRRAAGVHADELHDGGGDLGVIAAAGDAGAVAGGEIQHQQLYLAGGEGVQRGIPILAVLKAYLGQGHGGVLPPEGAGGQVRAAIVLRKDVGAAAYGHRAALRARFDHGDVQPAGQGAQRTGQPDHHRAVPRRHAGYVLQPLGVPGAGARPLQCGGHVLGGDGRAIGKQGVRPDADRPDKALAVVLPAVRQHRLGLELLIQRKQTIVQQRAHRLLYRVRGGDGIQRLAGDVGQGQGGQRLRLRLVVFRLIEAGQLAQRIVCRLPVGAAGGTQQHQRQQQAEKGTFHSVSSRRAISAACSPRRSPIFRWLQ